MSPASSQLRGSPCTWFPFKEWSSSDKEKEERNFASTRQTSLWSLFYKTSSEEGESKGGRFLSFPALFFVFLRASNSVQVSKIVEITEMENWRSWDFKSSATETAVWQCFGVCL
ncbi:PREDICTED: uncharacterized protein LOC101291407 [Fragaria vesca subsp. vesca]